MKENQLYYPKPAPIYPGMYEPLPGQEQELMSELIKKSPRIIKPPVNISELPDHYRIEMPAPGFRREDFFIKTFGDSLSISAINKHYCKRSDEHYRFHGFNCEFIKRHIDLPDDVDTDFGAAEYKNGILYIYLYKTIYKVANTQGSLVVY